MLPGQIKLGSTSCPRKMLCPFNANAAEDSVYTKKSWIINCSKNMKPKIAPQPQQQLERPWQSRRCRDLLVGRRTQSAWWHCLGQPPPQLPPPQPGCSCTWRCSLVQPPFGQCHVAQAGCVLCVRYIKKTEEQNTEKNEKNIFNKLCALLRCMLYNSCTWHLHISSWPDSYCCVLA